MQKDTNQFVIDDAREVLPKLSKANLSFLALYVFSLISIPTNSKDEYKLYVEKLSKLLSNLKQLSALDIMYLKQQGCATGVQMIHVNEKLEKSLLTNYEYYFSKEISIEELSRLLDTYHPIEQNDMMIITSLIHISKNNGVSLRFSSQSRLANFSQQNNFPKTQAFFNEFITLQGKPTLEDTIDFHKNINNDWEYAFDLWKRQDIVSLSIMPVGLYIGSVYLGKEIGMKIPQNIFYQ